MARCGPEGFIIQSYLIVFAGTFVLLKLNSHRRGCLQHVCILIKKVNTMMRRSDSHDIHFPSLLKWKKEAADLSAAWLWNSPPYQFLDYLCLTLSVLLSVPAARSPLKASSLIRVGNTKEKTWLMRWQFLYRAPRAAKCQPNSKGLTCNLKRNESKKWVKDLCFTTQLRHRWYDVFTVWRQRHIWMEYPSSIG